MNYSLSHACTIRWALEMELGSIKVHKNECQEVIDYLTKRLKELKDLENELNKINAKGSS